MALGAAGALMLSLSGCGGESAGGDAVSLPAVEAADIAIVCGYHRNAQKPPVHDAELEKAITYSVRNCGSVTIVVSDGDPYATLDFTIDAGQVAEMTTARQEQLIEETIAEAYTALTETRAVTPEVDTLEAIRQAARGLTSAEGGRCMYILDSGLTTAGDLNVLADNLHRLSDVTPVVEKLQEDHALPDLNGVQVVWIGLGDVAGDQEELTSPNRNTLEELWTAVLNAAGADVIFQSPPVTQKAEEDDTLPEVTPIEIVQDEDQFDPLTINQVKPKFVGDQAVLIDEEETKSDLAPVVDYLLEHPSYSIILAGTTATAGTDDACKRLGLERAETIRELMISMGVPQGQILRTIGLGYEHEFHVDDLNPDGSLNEHNAPENRAVLVVGAATEAAQLLEKY